MADLFLTLSQLNDLFWKATMTALGYNPNDYKNDLHDPNMPMPVRKSWPTDGAPAWKITEDVCFIRIGEQDQDINKQINIVFTPIINDLDNANQTNGQTRVLNVSWIFYGPNSFDNAFKTRRSLFLPIFRDLLDPYQIFLIPTTRAPVRAPELYAGQWWERTDLEAQFNELVKFESTVPYIKTATIEIVKEDGEAENVIIEP